MSSDEINQGSVSNPEHHENAILIQRDKWLCIMAYSDQLLQLAHQKNWTALMDLHQRRDELLDQFFREIIASDLIEQIQNDIPTIKNVDLEIIRLVKNNREQLGNEAHLLQNMKKRINSYLSAEGKKL